MSKLTKTVVLFCLTLAAFAGAPLLASGFVYETEHEFTASGDFDGDGLEDLVVVDRETGFYRVAYQNVSGDFEQTPARASGLKQIAGIAVGKLLDPAYDAIAFTARDSNRIQTLSAFDRASPGVPLSVFPEAVGPEAVVAIDIGGAGNTPLHDLMVGSVWNDLPDNNRLNVIRNSGGAFSDMGVFEPVEQLARGNRILLNSSYQDMAAVVGRGSSDDRFRVYDLSSGYSGASLVLSLTGLPMGVDYATGFFDGTGYCHVLFYEPGTTDLIARPVQEPTPGVYQFGAPVTYPMGQNIFQVNVIPGSGGPDQLLILFEDGAVASTFSFNGGSPPAMTQTITAENGARFTSAPTLADGRFLLFINDSNTYVSQYFDVYSNPGGGYASTQDGAFQPMHAGAAPTSLLLFEKEPFVNKDPNLKRSLNAGDWTTDVSFPGGSIQAVRESFANSGSGLGGASPVSMGSQLSGENFGLVSQYRNHISVKSFTNAEGIPGLSARAIPDGGLYGQTITVSLESPGSALHYRPDHASNWTTYSGPFPVFTDTTLHFYAENGADRSPVYTVTYRFQKSPDHLDSDGDGVPDYVEVGAGLDPVAGGHDSDGDGFSDLEELVLGSDPNSASSTPDNWVPGDPRPRPSLEQHASFDIIQTVKPFDGTTLSNTYADIGTRLQAYDYQGNLLAQTVVGHDPAEVKGLSLWLRADALALDSGDPVTSWEDLSANDRHAVQATTGNQPTYIANAVNGLPVVRFDGNDRLVTSGDSYSFENFTAFVVFKDTGDVRPSERLVDHDRASGFWIGRENAGSTLWGGGIRQAGPPYGIYGTHAAGAFHIMSFGRSDTDHVIRRNGNLLTSGSVSSADTGLNPIAIGGKVDGTTPGEWLTGDIAEVLIYDRALSPKDLHKVETHLLAKYGFQTATAHFDDLPVDREKPVVMIGTQAHYTIDTTHADPLIGREMVAAIATPSPAPVTVSYTYGGGDAATESAAWIAAAQAAYAAAQRPAVTGDLEIQDTLVALLLERILGNVLLARGDTVSKDITLLPWRDAQDARIRLTEEVAADLVNARAGLDSGYRSDVLAAEIENLLNTSSDSGILALKALHQKVYEISSELNNVPPRSFGSPIDVMRDFLGRGFLDENYVTEAGYSQAQLALALQGAALILSSQEARPIHTFILQVAQNTFSGTCTILETTDSTPEPKSLFNAQNQPYDLLQASSLNLVPGVRFEITAYTDSTASSCGGEQVLEVISAHIVEAPIPQTKSKDISEPAPPQPVGKRPVGEVLSVARDAESTNKGKPVKPNQEGTEESFITRIEIPGEEGVNTVGDWSFEDTAITVTGGRGLVDFQFENQTADIYRLELQGAGDQEGLQEFNLRLYLDGVYLGRHKLSASNGQSGFIHLYTPWISAGPHTLQALLDETPKCDPFMVEFIRFQERTGPDSNGNGVKDWVERLLFDENDIEIAPKTSLTSPVAIEGRSPYPGMIQLSGEVGAQPAPGGRWFANMQLSPDAPTLIEAGFQNGALLEERVIEWVPTILGDHHRLVIRKGDALLLTTAPDRQAGGKIQVQIGDEVLRSNAANPIIYRFNEAGSFTLQGAWMHSVVEKSQLEVEVLETDLGPNPTLWVGNKRQWDLKTLSEGVTLDFDGDLDLKETALLPGGGRRVELSADVAETRYVVARLGQDGPILASAAVEPFNLYTANHTWLKVAEVYEDGSQAVEMGVVVWPVPKDVRIRLTIIVGGISFEDGSLRKTLTQEDFDQLGVARVRFNRAASAKTSVCHITEAYQGFTFVGTVEQVRRKQ